MLASVWEDVRYSLRSWARRPGFAAVAVVTVALGIGANAAIFSVVDAVLFAPLPYRDADRLAMAWQTVPRLGWERGPVSYPNLLDWREQTRAFESLGAYQTGVPLTLSGPVGAEQVRAAAVTTNVTEVLGAGPMLGRGFTAQEGEPGGPRAVVLGHDLWRQRFGGDAAVLGGSLVLNGQGYTIVGVLPPRFDFPSPRDQVWVPLRLDPTETERDTHFLTGFGRLREGVTRAAAQADLEMVFERLRTEYPEIMGDRQPNVEPYRAYVAGDVRPALLVLSVAVLLVLAIVCANVANLLLIRGTARARELAVRSALGADWRRLTRQLLTESATLAALGGAAGLGIAWGLTRLVVAIGPASLPRREYIAVDARTALFALGAAALCTLLFGVIPALRASRRDPGAPLREGGRTGMVGGARARLQRVLVVTQVAVAIVLLTGAGLLVHSFVRLSGTPAGLDADGVLTARVALPESRYDSPERVQAFYDALFARIRALPGVELAGAAWGLPFTTMSASGRITVEGDPRPAGEETTLGFAPVDGDYFRALGIPLLEGRLPGARDDADAAPVMVVNRTAAERLWPGQSAVGKRLKTGAADEDEPWITVVGVVGDVRRGGLDAEVPLEGHFPRPQAPWSTDMTLVVRAARDPLDLVAPIRAELRELDAGIPLAGVQTMAAYISTSIAQPRFRTMLMAVFAALATVLALLGVYGVMAFLVAQRRHDIGVRMALGAERGRVLRGVMSQGLRLTAIGAILGLAGSFTLTRLLESMLFGIDRLDPVTYAAVIALLGAGALLACLVPARRASRVDPLTTLRAD